jgi:hypothetical protein
VCRRFCAGIPWRVPVRDEDFIYTYGEQSGVCVTAINYARFPETYASMMVKVTALAQLLADELCQRSYSIMTDRESLFFARKIDS